MHQCACNFHVDLYLLDNNNLHMLYHSYPCQGPSAQHIPYPSSSQGMHLAFTTKCLSVLQLQCLYVTTSEQTFSRVVYRFEISCWQAVSHSTSYEITPHVSCVELGHLSSCMECFSNSYPTLVWESQLNVSTQSSTGTFCFSVARVASISAQETSSLPVFFHSERHLRYPLWKYLLSLPSNYYQQLYFGHYLHHRTSL